ncbi:TetR/AcrR family transcriptional regulator [Actinomadura geliboluensis]|uniref:TetR/AcrR family transcriptional regulator n=1 Tax=Actinomadura geliboluensis TaxID=882440 RepID=A0A5S4H9M9_9ACTN|nr:TetR/AcrR family transcriptional regulator [Actinomadura geliboluensis]TMR41955.1 TetR/AcrR family transcriptional regulator [Actinomadura geliboluensis]
MSEAGRDRILRAALEAFGRDGVAGTTLSALRAASGVSVGSFYHHFSGKEQVAEALFVECVSLYQDAFLAELKAHASARGAVTGVVAFHVRWCREHAARARFMFTERPAASDALAERNRAFYREVRAWWRVQARHGALIDVDTMTAFVLWLGPAQELCRFWLNGQGAEPDGGQVEVLSEAAWRSVGSSRGD